MWDLLMKYLCPRDFRRGEMEEKMKAFIQLRTFIKLRGICHGNQFGKRNEQRKMKWKKNGNFKVKWYP